MDLKKSKLAFLLGFKGRSEKQPACLAEDSLITDIAGDRSIGSDQSASLQQRIDTGIVVDQPADIDALGVLSQDSASVDSKVEIETQEPGVEYEEYLVVNFSKEQLVLCEKKLAEFMKVCTGAYGVLISTVDGHEIAYSLKRDMPPHKISTMNSSLLALGESIARESLQRLCQFVILENSDGRVVSLRINEILMLTCISTKDTNLGMLLSAGRNTADFLAKIL